MYAYRKTNVLKQKRFRKLLYLALAIEFYFREQYIHDVTVHNSDIPLKLNSALNKQIS